MMRVQAVHLAARHTFTKATTPAINLIAGRGVAGDAHCGETVQHRSRVKADPTAPNLRQVHLIGKETLDTLVTRGFTVAPGDLGENITTIGIDLLQLARDTRLTFPSGAVVVITGLRNPCGQLDQFQSGLMGALRERGAGGEVIRKAGVMGVVEQGGDVCAGDPVTLLAPPAQIPLEVV